MDMPKRLRGFVSVDEWRLLALDRLDRDDRAQVENVLRAFCSTKFDREEDRALAFQFVLKYRRAFCAWPDLDGISKEETLNAIETATHVIVDLQADDEEEDREPCSPAPPKEDE